MIRTIPLAALVVGLAASAVLPSSAIPAAAQEPSQAIPDARPHVLVLATGGTIAGVQAEPGTLEGYEVARSANEIVAAIPVVERYAQVETEQFSNILSYDMTPAIWLELGRRINEVFAQRPELAGIVVTHGTARLEETAFFLHLAVDDERPVVLVGAQRPSTGISPDGPLNLLSAVRVAASPEARGKGGLVVMDDRILSAREVRKVYARGGGFETGEMGMLGVVTGGGPVFYYAPVRRHTAASGFDLEAVEAFPEVTVAYSYAGAPGALPADAAGVVVATTGFTPAERAFYADLRRRGVVVARTFPSGEQARAPGGADAEGGVPPLVAASHLTPLKARILLMLALTVTDDAREIQAIFDAH